MAAPHQVYSNPQYTQGDRLSSWRTAPPRRSRRSWNVDRDVDVVGVHIEADDAARRSHLGHRRTERAAGEDVLDLPCGDEIRIVAIDDQPLRSNASLRGWPVHELAYRTAFPGHA